MVASLPTTGTVLIDTSAFFATADLHDENHAAAGSTTMLITRQRWRAATTNLILPETHALFLARYGRRTALERLRDIERSTITIVRVTQEDEDQARKILSTYDDKDFSLTDATSFAVIERLRIAYAFTFDHNFVQYGIRTLSSR